MLCVVLPMLATQHSATMSRASGRKRRAADGEARRSAPRRQHPALPIPVHAGRGGLMSRASSSSSSSPPSSSFVLLLPPPPPPRPRSSLRALLLGCAGALKHCCSAAASHEGAQSRGEQVTFTFCVRSPLLLSFDPRLPLLLLLHVI